MSTIRSQQTGAWVRNLQAAAEQNRAVDLAPASGGRGWRVRLLALEEQSLVVEHPPIRGEGSALRPDQQVELRLVQDQARWLLRCSVIERIKFQLSEGNEIPAARLAWPTDVQHGQRRAHFRVATVGPDRPELRLWLLEDVSQAATAEQAVQDAWRTRHLNKPAATPLPRPAVGRELQAMAADVSGGGACFAMPRHLTGLLKHDPLLWLEMTMPGDPLPLVAVAKVAHWEQQDNFLRVGLAFVFNHHPEYETFLADRLCRAAVAIQRLQLRRGKKAS